MTFCSPSKSRRSSEHESFLNSYGTPLCRRRSRSPKFTPIESERVLTFLSPEPSSAGLSKTSVGYIRKRGSPIIGAENILRYDNEDCKSLDESLYLGTSVSSRDTGGERIRTKRKAVGIVDVFRGAETEVKPLSYFFGSCSRKRRRIGNLMGVSAKSTTDLLHYSYKMIDH